MALPIPVLKPANSVNIKANATLSKSIEYIPLNN
jgi:hypothetical protein